MSHQKDVKYNYEDIFHSSTGELESGGTDNLEIESNNSETDLLKEDLRYEARPTKLIIVITIASSISGFMFGYDTGYISSALVNVGKDLSNKFLTSGEKELITSATSLGALIGAIIGGLLANLLGRKMVIMGSNAVFIVGSIIQVAAHTVWTMIVGRFILGLGVGVAALIAPLMLGELAPSKYRGRLIVVNCLFITGGQLVAYLINWGLANVKHGWKISVGLCMIPPIIQSVLFVFLPDTARFYIINGKVEAAKNVMRRTYLRPSEEFLERQVQEMIASNSQVPGSSPLSQSFNSLKLIHTEPANFRALILACGLQGIQQFTGFNSLMYFSSTIFETVGFENSSAVSVIITATNFVFTVIALLIIDRVGRRRILLFSIPTMCMALVLCAIGFHFLGVKFTSSSDVHVEKHGISGWGIVIILGMVVYVAGYAVGIGNSAWTGVDLFSDVNVRSVGCMFATGTNWVGSLVIAATYLTMLINITPTGTFALFAGLCVVSYFFVLFLLPEVSGLKLEETTEFLSKGFRVKEANRLSRERKKQIRDALREE